MRPLILSRDSSLYSTRRLVTACRDRGHEAVVVDPTWYSVRMDNPPRVATPDGVLENVDVAIPRLGHSTLVAGLNVLRAMQGAGVPCLNAPDAIAIARDKSRVALALAQAGVSVPRSVLLHHSDGTEQAIDAVGGAPLLLKFLDGSRGVGIVLAESEASARSMIDAMLAGGKPLLVQEYIRHGRDLRIFVIDGRVVAAMERQAKPGEFRANIHRGGMAVNIEPGPEVEDLALRAVKAVGLDIAGVDLVGGDGAYAVVDVNASPGFEGIEGASGKDIARMIVDSAISRVRGR